MSKAMIALVNIGSNIEIEGLRLPNGTFAVSVSQVAALFSINPSNATKTTKALLGANSSLLQTASELHSQKVNTVSLSQFDTILTQLDRKGNLKAQELRDALSGLALNELFCDAFGIVSDARTRRAWLDARFKGMEERTSLTDAIKDWLECNKVSDTAQKFLYSNVSDKLNIGLTGHKAKYWRDIVGCSDNAALRDRWKDSHLDHIKSVEQHATRLIVKGQTPMDAIELALEFFDFSVDEAPTA